MHKKSTLHIIAIFGLLLLNIFLFKNPFIGAALFLLITSLYGFLLNRQNQKLGSILFILYLMSVGGAIYFFYQINLLISLLLLILPILFIFFKKSLRIPELKFSKPKYSLSKVLTSALLIDLLLILFLFFKQTDQLLISPWQITSSLFFILFFVSTWLLLYEGLQIKSPPGLRSPQSLLSLPLSVHLFLSFGIASLLYKLGFGFDGFIHRATQEYIFEHNFILPKQPFYLGQYALVTMLGHITSIPIKFIDIYLVPVATAILLPISFKQLEIKNKIKHAALFSLLVPFIYFITLNLTTPHNIVILLTIAGALFSFSKNYKMAWAFAITAMLTHPLPGLPLFLFVLASNLVNKNKLNIKFKKLIPASLLLITSFAPSLMFILQNMRSGFSFPDLVNPFTQINKFIELFNKPYWYLENAGFILDRLYDWQYIIGLVVILLGLYGLFINRKNKTAQITFSLFLGLWIGAWLLRSWIYFPNVASYEQGNYPLRLTNASILYLLPFMALALNNLYKPVKSLCDHGSRKLIAQISIITIISGLLMLSLYFSYPQRNHKARFPGYNVTAQDMQTVEYINNINSNLEYTVLSNPLVSISALTKYGFLKHFDTAQGELFYYAIPTGGPLYQLYGDMLYKDQKRSTMIEAMNLMGVDKAYFVLNSYWGNSEKIKKGAMASSDDMFVVGDGVNEVFVFGYYR